MIVVSPLLTLSEYLEYNDGTDARYELVNGELVAMAQPTGIHGGMSEFVNDAFRSEIQRRQLPLISKQELIAVQTGLIGGKITCRIPDVMVVTSEQWNEIKFREAVLIDSIPLLVVEIVSDSTRNIDYRKKRAEYNAIEIPEYWIIDFSDRKVTVLLLEDGLYEEIVYREEENIKSLLFTELQLTPDRIFNV
ncbi:Uma2 family endonuclease [Tumidithrix helvetica PCC 7403]|uniref:Uma2 family endonuclease n=1 Tax=Tumidithrix elongata BACA0141 TaxID=2716417 RepID=A0AAW9Q9M5_9CYAN|nr:Uma2 family endonuclease [Tumidithrix elongata RA019]